MIIPQCQWCACVVQITAWGKKNYDARYELTPVFVASPKKCTFLRQTAPTTVPAAGALIQMHPCFQTRTCMPHPLPNQARWNTNGTVLAISGSARAQINKTGQSRDLSVVKLYSPYGAVLRTLKVRRFKSRHFVWKTVCQLYKRHFSGQTRLTVHGFPVFTLAIIGNL